LSFVGGSAVFCAGASGLYRLFLLSQVPLGITTKNEAKIEDMISILEELQTYVPRDADDAFVPLGFGGDQLTVRNARIAQRTRSTSEDPVERLEGFVPIALDWHAECNLLQVCSGMHVWLVKTYTCS
jgi:hypothetical protein